MKQIPKKMLDSLIYMKRLYWKDGDKELLEGIHALNDKIESVCGLDWLAIDCFVSSIVKRKGLAPEADNTVIYKALAVFGWEVVESVEIDTPN